MKKQDRVGVAVLCATMVCAAMVLGQVQAAPADVSDNQLLARLKDLLRREHAHSKSDIGVGAVDLDIDRGHRQLINSTLTGHDQRGQRASGLTQKQKNQAVKYHNKLRKQEGASNMEKMRWSGRLAELAQDWANRCAWGHRPMNTINPQDYGFSSIGENIWAWSAIGVKTIPDDPIQDWYNEKDYYDYNSNWCRQEPCGHYTTVTWATTTHVGCGYAECGHLANVGFSNAAYVVCNYGPWGAGEQPFKKGKACTKCDRGQFYCTGDMCDSSCSSDGGSDECKCEASCECGSQTKNCKCKCQKGFSGADCSEKCEDKDGQCGANPGWPKSWCTDKFVFNGMMYDTVNTKCPKMCGHCEPGNEPCKSSRSVEKLVEKLDKADLELLIQSLKEEQ